MRRRTPERLLDASTSTRSEAKGASSHRPGFSLIELVVVLAVTLLLTGLLLPALAGLREHTNRVISASNMRQHGIGMAMYATDNNERLPYSRLIHADPPIEQEMMALHLGPELLQLVRGAPQHHTFWDGMGLLYDEEYLNAPEVFYCPSHTGDHPYEKYQYRFLEYPEPYGTIYSNYHYRGDIDPTDPKNTRPFTLDGDSHRVFLTDGMRTRRDFNHKVGFNSLYGDGSVIWRFDVGGEIFSQLPFNPGQGSNVAYQDLWKHIDDDGSGN